MSDLKRYLVFKGNRFYPKGGWGDFVCDFNTLESAFSEAKSFMKDPHCDEWSEVVDLQTRTTLAMFKCENGEIIHV